jgi:D-hydroxyproline dehydrogenase subunit alpha
VPDFEILVVGAGPAGMAAAVTAASHGKRVALLDDNPAHGGQIWRGETRGRWFERLAGAKVERLYGVRVLAPVRHGRLLAEREGAPLEFGYQQLILATGARERWIPFPGWTLPHVTGAGGLQALVKGGYPIAGKRIVVAGSGPLLLAVAAALRKHGARMVLVAEQASWRSLVSFAGAAIGKLPQAVSFLGLPYRANCWPVETVPGSVTLNDGRRVACDYLACGFGLLPNTELAQVLGCELDAGFVCVDAFQQTTQPGIYCVGEPVAIGGLDAALVQGQLAGHAAAGDAASARRLGPARDRWLRFAAALDRAFRLREELRHLARLETIVCRCEDVPLQRIVEHRTWRGIKLQTRCGMGPCQGRVCGLAVEWITGIGPESVRPPVFPATVRTLSGPED